MNRKLKYKIRLLVLIVLLVSMNLGINIVNDLNFYENETINMDLSEEFLLITAKSGDSIWKIVENNIDKINKPNNMDFRDVVYIVSSLNGGIDINSGQVIKLPIYK